MLTVLGAVSWPAAANEPVILGTWITARGGEITVAPCEVGYCGSISQITLPDDLPEDERAAAESIGFENLIDARNPDPELRDRPMLGLVILEINGAKSPYLYEGTIYNPEDGNTYTGKLEVLDGDHLRLSGCVFFDLLCRGEDWSRKPPEPPEPRAPLERPGEPIALE